MAVSAWAGGIAVLTEDTAQLIRTARNCQTLPEVAAWRPHMGRNV